MPCLSAGPLTAPCLVWAFPARLCGFVVPDPMLSSSGVMLISFQSDENVTFRGFQAMVSFVPETGKKKHQVLGFQFPSSCGRKGQPMRPGVDIAGSRYLQELGSIKSPGTPN